MAYASSSSPFHLPVVHPAAASLSFHYKCGHLVTLSPELKSASRTHAATEFNHGLVFSSRPLQDDEIFEVRIDSKVNSWSGSIEVGVTVCDPESLVTPFPSSATELRSGAWIMSGNSIQRDGRVIQENYGTDLARLEEGDRVGVVKTAQGDLIFFVNGVSQSVAASQLPAKVFAVVDLYGKCARVSIMDNSVQEARIMSNDLSNVATAAASSTNHLNLLSKNSAHHNITNSHIAAMASSLNSNGGQTAHGSTLTTSHGSGSGTTSQKIRFHECKGSLIKVSNNSRTAERRRPCDEFNNGVVMTHRPLRDNELFEIRIDRLVDKWSGSIEVGISIHNPSSLEFPSTMTNQRSGTLMMSGCGILTNGRGTRREYGEYNLDELKEGDRIGMMRKSNGNLHFYINGLDQGVAATKVPQQMWGVVDLYGMTVKVTIVDRDERDEQNLITRRNVAMRELFPDENRLLFHPNCGSHAAVMNGGMSAHRPNAGDDFNFGVVLTNRPLRPNEIFEVRLDKMVSKWAGSIEIGVTTHPPSELDFPSTMTNIRSGTWMMTGNGSEATSATFYSQLDTNDLRFHHLHGRNARISNNGLTASRPNALGEFNDAIVISNRPLRDGELFEIVIERMVERWSGAIEAGMTLIRPEDLEFPNTMTDIDYETWMLSGSAVMQDGLTVRNGYSCDLDSLNVGSRLGMMRHLDGSLRYTINGEDQGIACENIPTGCYAVIDLYGQCAQVSLVHAPLQVQENSLTSSQVLESSHISIPIGTEVSHRFHSSHSKGLELRTNGQTCARVNLGESSLVLGHHALHEGDYFEIKVEEVDPKLAGSLKIGVTSFVPQENMSLSERLISRSTTNLWLEGTRVKLNDRVIKTNYCATLDRLAKGDRVGLRRTQDGALKFFINGEDCGVAVETLPKKMWPIVNLSEAVTSITVSSLGHQVQSPGHDSLGSQFRPTLITLQDSLETHVMRDFPDEIVKALEFHENRGRNINLRNGNTLAIRPDSYNQGVTLTNRPLRREELFELKIERLLTKWTSSLMVGVFFQSPDKFHLPVNGLGFKKNCILVCADNVFQNGSKIMGPYGPNLDHLGMSQSVGILVDNLNQLHLYVNGIDQGVAARDLPPICYGLVDLYGQCAEVSIVNRNIAEQEEPDLGVIGLHEDETSNMKTTKKQPLCHLSLSESFSLVKNCDYLNLCQRFKNSLGLPNSYFTADYPICFCPNCFKIRGEPPYMKKGDPLKDYATPTGWSKFVLKTKHEPAMVEKMHTAFIGTKSALVRRVLDLGEITPPGELGLEQNSEKKKLKEDDSDTTQLVLTPTLKYIIAYPGWSQINRFKDKITQSVYIARIAFQVEIQPGSYKIGPPTAFDLKTAPDPHFKLDETEWLTKERGNTAVSALLVKLDKA
ncbi:hypothetical protein TCAL_09119 [Tigriopus californicus]|uniref:NHR domain-containing protein n=1 Tax=Tigriopus californicus TaxID=6832 RepID=A0A553P8D0_TIGCA|nr:hypothetical protein TCAL_09119 [Tigriopus californicus]|eukprot:TCALIF_09119-PA protein Name:"Similar to neurl4 Neuralized-like protein 4 (Xenopus tropicalis)" AED:0.04 eAED:0.04 QI:182/0.66/0.5/1/0.66/1/4/73/1389